MLAYCRDIEVDKGTEAEIDRIQARLTRIKDLYAWGDMGKTEYLAERQILQADLARLTAAHQKPDHLGRLAQFLQDISLAWEVADQRQRNRLAAELFEMVWVEDGRVLAVTPRSDMVPFFDLIYAEATGQGVHTGDDSPSGPHPIFSA